MKTSPLGRGRAITEVIMTRKDDGRDGNKRSKRRSREDGRKREGME